MSRKSMELELLSLRFKHLTAEMRSAIAYIRKEKRCSDTSDVVIDGLWKEYKDDLIAMLRQNAGSSSAQLRDQPDQDLSGPTREVIRTWLEQALQHEAELSDLDDEAFETHYRDLMRPIAHERRARRARRAEENDRWDFFNTVEAEADFERWRDKPLSPAQAVALSLGKDPDVVTPERLKPYRTVGGSPFRERFRDRFGLLEAAITTGRLAVPLSIAEFAEWAGDRDWGLPLDLSTTKSQALSEEVAYWKALFEGSQADLTALRQSVDELPAKSRTSMYRMILGMAISKYNHKTVQRSKATTAIREDLRLCGLDLGSEAILRHLEDAANLLDVTWPPPQER